MNRINIQYHKTPVGEFILGAYDGQLCLLDFHYRKMRVAVDKRIQNGLNAEYVEQEDALLAEAIKQVDAYLTGKLTAFDLPLLTVGTEFQKSVWRGLQTIEYGKVATYLSLAEKVADAKAVRAVASANGANAMSLVIPCHRIIGSNGKLVGYAGGLRAKQCLLDLEQKALLLPNTLELNTLETTASAEEGASKLSTRNARRDNVSHKKLIEPTQVGFDFEDR